MSSTIAACLNPPAIDDASESLPPWILLDTRVYLARRDDDSSTKASARTSKGHHIQVSIRFANPPALSHVCVYCPDLNYDDNFAEEPRVVRSEKQFLLLHLPLNWSTTRYVRRSSEYYMYEAVPGKKPTLSLIPHPGGDSLLLMPRDLGIYCCNDDDGGYILAGLCLTRDLVGYELHLYSSASKSWTSKPACLDKPPTDEHLPGLAHKVVLLGGSLLAWVDLWKGMLVCDVLYDEPLDDPLDDPLNHPVPVWFIPLPGLLPGNRQDEHLCPWMVRDVTYTNGSLKLIEIEHLMVRNVVKETMVTSDDSCFVRPEDKIAPPRKFVGWRSVIWNRMLSDKGWRRGCELHADDILVANPSHSALLFPELGNGIVGRSALMNFLPSFPTLSIHGDDVVHMNCSPRLDIRKGWMISIDMSNKALQTLDPCLPGELDAYCPHFPCVLSNHLSKNTPALPQALQVSYSGNVTENQRPRSRAQEVTSVPNRAQNGGSNFDLSLVPQRQQSFGLLDARTSYNRSHCEYADYTHPSYDNYHRSLALQQRPAYPPNGLDIPSWFSSRSVNAHPASCPVFGTVALGQMSHPSQAVPLNNCHMFRLPSEAVVRPMPSPLPSIPHAVAGRPIPGTRRRRPHRHSPYDRTQPNEFP